jgi:hypothetical protein
MWHVIRGLNPGFDEEDVRTWSQLRSAGAYGLSMRGPCFHPTLVQNRCNAKLMTVFRTLVGEDAMVSQDRFTIYRSTLVSPDAAQYRTGEKNVHLDLNPWWWAESSTDVSKGVQTLRYDNPQSFIKENNLVVESMGRHVQCVLNFCDNKPEDGGTVIGNDLHLMKPFPFHQRHL